MYSLLIENRLMLYGMIAAIFIIINLSAILLIKYLLPWQAMRVMRKCKIHLKNRRVIPLLNLMGQLVLSLSGSITRGVPLVTDIIPVGITPSKLMTITASAEAGIKHPLAEAIIEWVEDKDIALLEAAAVNAVPGKGVEALINHQEIRVGTAAFLQEQDVNIPAEILTRADQLASKGNFISFVSIGNFCRGFIVFSDRVRDTAPGAVRALPEFGISTSILTSTVRSTARNLAKQTGIMVVRPELNAMEKAKEFMVLKTKNSLIGAIGTTKNSAVLMQYADISFTLSTSDEALKEESDVYIDSVDFGNILSAVDIARYTYGKRKTGLIITVLSNLLLGAVTSYLVAEPALPFFAPVLPILTGTVALVSIIANQLTYKY